MHGILYRTVRQGKKGTLVYDAGDNAAIDATAGPLPRLQLMAGESCSSATVTCITKPTGATVGTILAGDDLELGTPAAVSTNTECNDRIVETGEGITIAYTFADDAPLGTYVLKGEIATSASRQVPYCIHISLIGCA